MPESRGVNHWLAAGLGSGWLPKAPGTWGSLAALVPAWLIIEWLGAMGLLLASGLLLAIACRICATVLADMQAENDDRDPGWIVIDEWVGQWLCLALLLPFMGAGWLTFLIAFAAFRLFDIFKPWPISRIEKLGPAWWSIMADDVAAGVIGAGLVIAVAMQFGLA